MSQCEKDMGKKNDRQKIVCCESSPVRKATDRLVPVESGYVMAERFFQSLLIFKDLSIKIGQGFESNKLHSDIGPEVLRALELPWRTSPLVTNSERIHSKYMVLLEPPICISFQVAV